MIFYTSGDEKFREVKKIINLEKLENSGIKERLEEKLRPEAVVLIGSFLEGRDDEESDIDLAIINGRNRDVDLRDFEEELGRDIQLTHVENPREENPEFKNSLANGLVLYGYLELN